MKIRKYPLSKSQFAQIDCRRSDCIFQDKGDCNNISPAITLSPGKTAVCWSHQTKVEDEA